MTMKLTPYAIALFLLAMTGPARADFTACNQTDNPIGLAIAHSNGIEWISEGWWTIGPQNCSVVLSGALKARYYYIYAIHHNVGGAWQGDRNFCTASRSFTITGREDCEKRGYKPVGFYEIDTGDSVNWEEYLYEDGDETPAAP